MSHKAGAMPIELYSVMALHGPRRASWQWLSRARLCAWCSFAHEDPSCVRWTQPSAYRRGQVGNEYAKTRKEREDGTAYSHDRLRTQAQTVYFGIQTLLISSWPEGHRCFTEASGTIVRSAIIRSPRLRTAMAATIVKTFILGIPSHTLRCMYPLQDCLLR